MDYVYLILSYYWKYVLEMSFSAATMHVTEKTGEFNIWPIGESRHHLILNEIELDNCFQKMMYTIVFKLLNLYYIIIAHNPNLPYYITHIASWIYHHYLWL